MREPSHLYYRPAVTGIIYKIKLILEMLDHFLREVAALLSKTFPFLHLLSFKHFLKTGTGWAAGDRGAGMYACYRYSGTGENEGGTQGHWGPGRGVIHTYFPQATQRPIQSLLVRFDFVSELPEYKMLVTSLQLKF